MKATVMSCLFVLVGCVSAKPETGNIASVCNAEDEDCVKESLKTFLRTTSQGIPAFDVRPLDPNVIPRINYTLGAFGVGYTFTNLTVIGMKNLRLAEYNIDRTAKTSLIKTEATLSYESQVEIDYLRLGKVFTGNYAGAGKALVTVKYPYGITTDDKGVQHFDVQQETIECQPIEASGGFNDELLKAMNDDPQVAELRSKLEEAKDKEAALKAGFCRLAKQVFTTFVHNIRASAKGLPKEAFFKNI